VLFLAKARSDLFLNKKPFQARKGIIGLNAPWKIVNVVSRQGAKFFIFYLNKKPI
jgi:hypothetical protein